MLYLEVDLNDTYAYRIYLEKVVGGSGLEPPTSTMST